MELSCQHIHKAFQTQNGTIIALEDVTFRTKEKEFLCIVGPSGCGKTTLLKLIAGLLKPNSGEMIFHGEVSDHRSRTALVFQEHGLFPWMTVLDNVAFGLEIRGIRKKERHELAQTFVQKVGLSSFSHNYPHELSVGMRQRVGIARAFIADAPILLMDEPFGSIDAQTKRFLQEELLRLWKDHQKLILYVTHDIEEAVILADRILVMTGHPGRIREQISIPFSRPRDLYTRKSADLTEIKWHIWKILEDEVQKGLWIPD